MKKVLVLLQNNQHIQKFIQILKKFTLLAIAIISTGLYFLIETISRHSLWEAFLFMTKSPVVFIYNTFMIFTTFMLIYIVKRRLFATVLIAAVWLAMGIANGIILAFRVTPFTGTDLTLVVNAMSLITAYLSIEQIILIAVSAVAVIALIVLAWFRLPVRKSRILYGRNIILIAGCFGALVLATKVNINNRVLSAYFGNIAFAYEDYGFPYCFSMSIFATGIDCPYEYSKKLMDSIEKSLGEEQQEAGHTPNIIFLQLESFFDPELIKYLRFSEDPIPNFRRLKEQFSSGFLTVPSVGAGTANTEFEVMTGMSLRYFGPGEYPYKTVLKSAPCESVPFNLKKLGYETTAIHNNEASFYDRMNVFANLGYDRFVSEEYMNIREYTPMGWAKDECLIGEITAVLDASEGQDYIYAISVQGHGGYPDEPVYAKQDIEVFGTRNEGEKNSFTYYVNQIHEMDQVIRELTEALSKRDEETILVMYGDHLPTLGLEASHLVNHSLFQTEYVIWDNMGLEKTERGLSAYQLSAAVLNRAGIHTGILTRFHQSRTGSKTYMADLDALQYDMLYGEKYIYDGELPFKASPVRMGVKPITVERAARGENKSIYVTGRNFTKASRIYINEEECETVWIDEFTLKAENKAAAGGDRVEVCQVSSGYGILTKSNLYIMGN